jgi:hypothetical protein
MTFLLDPTTARIVARDRAADLRRAWVTPLDTVPWWTTGGPTRSGLADGTPTEKHACRTNRTPASAS